MSTPILSLDELVEAQASKYVTHNTALRQIEAFTIRVLDRNSSGPPGSPSDGDAYIVDSATGNWSSFSVNDIAAYIGSTWYAVTPKEGMRVWVNDEDSLYVYYSSAWNVLASSGASHTQLHSMTSTSDHQAGNNKLFYSDGSAHVQELSLAAAYKILRSAGTTSAPVFGTADIMLASVTADMQNGDSKTDVFTVPTGLSMVVTKVVIRNPSDSLAGGTDYDLGDGASADTWKQTVDLSSMTATTDYFIITNDNTKITVFDAGDVFGIIPVTGATADTTATVELFGYLF